MPTIVSTTYTDLSTGSTVSTAKRLVKTVFDATGTGLLIWDLNDGVLPDYPAYNMEVYANGLRKEYTSEFTIIRNTAPGQSTVVINPSIVLSEVYYVIIVYL